MPDETKTMNLTIPLIIEKIEQIKTKTKFTLHYKVEYEENGEWKVYDEGTEMIDVYPMDTMVWAMYDDEGNPIDLQDYIAVFVTPKDKAIQELLSVAKDYAIDDYDYRYSDYGLYRSLEGYQCKVCSNEEDWFIYTALHVMAIYNALQDWYGVSYVSTPTAFGKDAVQKVKLPSETLETASGNCIDLTVLFASALEALGMHPYIVLLPDHAFVAWEVKPGSGKLLALETTMVGSADFQTALEYGQKELNENWDALTDNDVWNGIIIDIEECREYGILPVK
jgi:hypothetical protein